VNAVWPVPLTCTQFLYLAVAGVKAVIDPRQDVVPTEVVLCTTRTVHVHCHRAYFSEIHKHTEIRSKLFSSRGDRPFSLGKNNMTIAVLGNHTP